MTTALQKQAAEMRAKVKEIEKTGGPLARDLYLSSKLVRSVIGRADDELADAADAKAAKDALAQARQAGPELAHVVELRQRGRNAEADIYERTHAHLLRDQRAAYEASTTPEPEPEPALSLMSTPEPPEAA